MITSLSDAARQTRAGAAPADPRSHRESTQGGLVKGGLTIYALPLRNRNTLGSVFNSQIENAPNC